MKKFKLKFILLLLAATFIIGNISALSNSDALTVPKVKSLSTASDAQAKSVRSSDTFTMIRDTSSNRNKYLK